LGYPPYHWAEHDDVPFTPLTKPLTEARLALITTAAPYRAELGDQGPGAAYNAGAKFFTVYRTPVEPTPDLRISHLGYDRKYTTAEDPASWLPIAQLQAAAADGRIGSLAGELVGVPTNRSQRVTTEVDAEAALNACIDQRADIALLVPS
ncbi:MAG: glycine/sarcosine/betaine reductase selenoprotein B family protein, partial [Pseudomonadota bacterium]